MVFIAFEGPDKTGKSTSARDIADPGSSFYNITKDAHQEIVTTRGTGSNRVVAYDRIDWMTHLAYRLGMPGYEWNDARVRTVFAMPETHLVIKLHDDLSSISDELYDGLSLAGVNRMYTHLAECLVEENQQQEFRLYKSISVVNVRHTSDGFRQELSTLSSRVLHYGSSQEKPRVESDCAFLDLLRYIESEETQ